MLSLCKINEYYRKEFGLGKLFYDYFGLKKVNLKKYKIEKSRVIDLSNVKDKSYLNYLSNTFEVVVFYYLVRKNYNEYTITNFKNILELKKKQLNDNNSLKYYNYYCKKFFELFQKEFEITYELIDICFYLSIFFCYVYNFHYFDKYLNDYETYKNLLCYDINNLFQNFLELELCLAKRFNIIDFKSIISTSTFFRDTFLEKPLSKKEIDFLTKNSIIELKIAKEDDLSHIYQILNYYVFYLIELFMNCNLINSINVSTLDNIILINPRLNYFYDIPIKKLVEKEDIILLVIMLLKFIYLTNKTLNICLVESLNSEDFKKSIETYLLKKENLEKLISIL
ncbi:MAG: hypothetical protein N3A01_08065 [Bacteroidales bacterium]|nr:hypothetical protein [Bacteroidales bacterium]